METAGLGESLPSIGGRDDFVTFRAQVGAQDELQFAVVIDEKDSAEITR